METDISSTSFSPSPPSTTLPPQDYPGSSSYKHLSFYSSLFSVLLHICLLLALLPLYKKEHFLPPSRPIMIEILAVAPSPPEQPVLPVSPSPPAPPAAAMEETISVNQESSFTPSKKTASTPLPPKQKQSPLKRNSSPAIPPTPALRHATQESPGTTTETDAEIAKRYTQVISARFQNILSSWLRNNPEDKRLMGGVIAVRVRIVINRAGNILTCILEESTGSSDLDYQFTAIVERMLNSTHYHLPAAPAIYAPHEEEMAFLLDVAF